MHYSLEVIPGPTVRQRSWGQRSGVSGSQDCGWCPTHTGTISPGPVEARRGLRGAGRGSLCSLFVRAGGLGWGPLYRVLSGQGNKNLVCR